MKKAWRWVTERQNQLIDWWEKLISRTQKLTTTRLNEQPCWVRAIVFVFRFVGSLILIAWLFYLFFLSFENEKPETQYLIWLTAGIVGWYFLYRRTTAAEDNTKAATQNAITAEKGLTVERFTRATEQLAKKELSIRLGGIISLEQAALAQKEEGKKIARILVSFINARARKNSNEVQEDLAAINLSELEHVDDFSAYRGQRLDVEAAIHALANIASELERQGQFRKQYDDKKRLCDLRNTDLRGLQLTEIDLSNFNLVKTDFSGARLANTNFTKASISLPTIPTISAIPTISTIPIIDEKDVAKFVRTDLSEADFSDTHLFNIDFSNSILEDTKFDDAYVGYAFFDECYIDRARFETSRGLTQEQINKAYCFDDEQPPLLPEGLKPPAP